MKGFLNFSKVFLTSTIVVVVSNSGLAQDGPSAGKEGAGKPFTISATLREEYDDNINTRPSNEEGSFKTILRPSIVFNYPLENTLFSARYTFGMTHYLDREGDDFDFSHDFLGRINHSFSPVFEIDLRDQFRFTQEPQLRSATGALRRRLGDGITNTVSLDGTVTWTDRFETVTGFFNTIERYNNAIVKAINNVTVYGVSQDFRFTVLPTTTAVANYSFEHYDYSTLNRDRDQHFALVGADHYLLPEWLLSGRAGAQFTLYENATFTDTTSPYVNLSTTWNYLPRSSVSGIYTFGTVSTDNSAFSSQENHTLALELTHYFTPKFSVGLLGEVSIGRFEQNQAFVNGTSAVDEVGYTGGINLAYDVTTWFAVETGYKHTTVDSDTATREYYRNQVYIQVKGTY